MSPFYSCLRKVITTGCLLAVTLLFCFFLPGSFVLAVDSGQEEVYRGGAVPLSDAELEELEDAIFHVSGPRNPEALDELPSKLKNTKHLPVVKSQEHLPTCAAFATTYYYKTYQEARERDWVNPDPAVNPERVASPAWGYIFGVPTGVIETARRISDHGIATWEEMPYELPLDMQYWPTTEEWKRFAEWRGDQVGTIPHNTPEGLLALKEHLAGDDLAVMAVLCNDNFDFYPEGEYIDNDVLYDNSEGSSRFGGDVNHAITLIGYDDNKKYEVDGVQKQGAFLFVNSWGTDWGIVEPDFGDGTDLGTRGFIWIAYDYFLQEKTESSHAVIMEDCIDYQPDKFALIGLEHTNGRQLFLDLWMNAYEFDNSDYQLPAMPVSTMSGPVSTEEYGPIAADISDFDYAVEQLASYLSVRQLGQLGGEGEVTYFALQEGDAPPFLESSEVPVSIYDYRDPPPPVSSFAVRAGIFNDAAIGFDDIKLRLGSHAWADFNKSGRPDLLISGLNLDGERINSGDNFTGIFINRGDGNFARSVSGELPQLRHSLLAVADYNNSGYPDVAISGTGESIFDDISGIYKNNGNLTFTEIEVELPSEKIEALHWADLNNSGRPDLVVTTARQVLIYENKGGDIFTPREPLFDTADYEEGEEGVDSRLYLTLAFGDSNGNGYADLAVIGEYYRRDEEDSGATIPRFEITRKPLSTVLFNQGSFNFIDSGADLPVLLSASAAWGDFNKNGRLDLAVTGYLDRPSENMEGMTAVYKNNGDGSFSPIDSDLGQAWNGTLAWGDLNNNGWMDLVVTGHNEYMYDNKERFPLDDPIAGPYPEWQYSNQTKVFLNQQGESLIHTDAGLPRVAHGIESRNNNYNNAAALVDYNQNNSLDVFLSGTKTRVFEYLPEYIQTGLYRNDLAELYDRANTPPEPPAELKANESDEPGAVKLSWDAASDVETPLEGLYYNLRVGTGPGAGNVISGVNAAVTPGRQLINGCEFLLRELPAGKYYWSVQTLDAGYAASNWSDEATFTIEEGCEDAYLPDDPDEDPDPDEPVFSDEEGRLAGRNRYETAIAISRDTFPEEESAAAVVIARGDEFPDALPGGVLAYQKGGPLLLTRPDQLSGIVADEIRRVLQTGGTIYILGGTGAISEAVEDEIAALHHSFQLKRLAGKGRVDTAREIAEEVGGQSGKAIIAYSHNFPDALAISSYAAREGIPILTSAQDSLSEPTGEYLSENQVEKVYLVGGTAVLSEEIFAQAAEIVGWAQVERLSGSNRYETAQAIATEFDPAPGIAALAYGDNFPDALAGGVNAAVYEAPILLVEEESIPEDISLYLQVKRNSLEEVIVYGGDAVISSAVKDAAEALIMVGEKELDIKDYYPQKGPGGSHVYLLLEKPLADGEEVQAYYNDEVVESAIATEKLLEVIVPPGADSGQIELRSGDLASNRVDFEVKEPLMKPLAEKTMQPTDQKQSLSYNDEITVTLPGDLLSESRMLSISRVEGAPPSDLMPLSEALVYDITVEGQEEFDDFIEIAIHYDPEMLDEARAVEEQLMPMRWDEDEKEWLPLSYYVDCDAGIIYIYTDHLSLVKLLTLYYVATWVTDLLEIGYDSYVTESETGSFRLIYKRDFFEQQTIFNMWDMFRPSLSDKFFYHPDHPDYIQDIGLLFELAYSNYQQAGLKPVPTTRTVWYRPWAEEVRDPINVKIDSKWIRTVGEPHYEKIFRKLHFNALDLALYDLADYLSYVNIGHELFHRVQHEYYSRWGMRTGSANYWWIEATAEYAGCNVAWAPTGGGNDDKGLVLDENLTYNIRPDFLSYSLDSRGRQEGWAREYEYAAGNFVKFLVEVKELDFAELIEHVAAGSPFSTLESYIMSQDELIHPGGALGAYYQHFARWAVFSEDSFLRDNNGELYPLVDLGSDQPGDNEIAEQKDVFTYPTENGIEVEVSGGEDILVDIYHLPVNERAGEGEPDKTYRLNSYSLEDEDILNVDLLQDSGVLYVLAVNYGESGTVFGADDQVTVTIREVLDDDENGENGDNTAGEVSHTFELQGDYSARLWAINIPQPDLEFTNPDTDDILTVDEQGAATLRGQVLSPDWEVLSEHVDELKIYRYTRENDMNRAYDNFESPLPDGETVQDYAWPAAIPVEVDTWNVEDDGSFRVNCQLPQAGRIYALMAVLEFTGGEQMIGVVKLGSPEKFEKQTSRSGETINWSITGLPRLFPYHDPFTDMHFYELPPEGASLNQDIKLQADLTASLWESGHRYMMSTTVRKANNQRVTDSEDFHWEEGMSDTHGGNFSVNLKRPYQYENSYDITYAVFDIEDNNRRVVNNQVTIFPWIYYSEEQIIYHYLRAKDEQANND